MLIYYSSHRFSTSKYNFNPSIYIYIYISGHHLSSNTFPYKYSAYSALEKNIYIQITLPLPTSISYTYNYCKCIIIPFQLFLTVAKDLSLLSIIHPILLSLTSIHGQQLLPSLLGFFSHLLQSSSQIPYMVDTTWPPLISSPMWRLLSPQLSLTMILPLLLAQLWKHNSWTRSRPTNTWSWTNCMPTTCCCSTTGNKVQALNQQRDNQ